MRLSPLLILYVRRLIRPRNNWHRTRPPQLILQVFSGGEEKKTQGNRLRPRPHARTEIRPPRRARQWLVDTWRAFDRPAPTTRLPAGSGARGWRLTTGRATGGRARGAGRRRGSGGKAGSVLFWGSARPSVSPRQWRSHARDGWILCGRDAASERPALVRFAAATAREVANGRHIVRAAPFAAVAGWFVSHERHAVGVLFFFFLY